MINPTHPPEDTTRPESLFAATPGSHRAAPETEDTAPTAPGDPTATAKPKAAKTKATKTKATKAKPEKVKPIKAKVHKAKVAKTTAQAEKSPETEAETAQAVISGTGEAEGTEVAPRAADTPATTEGEAARVMSAKEEGTKEEGAMADVATAGLEAEEPAREAVITEEIAPEAVITEEIAPEAVINEETEPEAVITEEIKPKAVEKPPKSKKNGPKKSKSAPEPEPTTPDLAPAAPDLAPLAIAEAAAQAAIDRALTALPSLAPGNLAAEDLTPLAIRPTLRVVVYGAIQQHFRKTTKARKAVLQDSDPEPLHQMRVGLRRLRSVLYTFDGVMEMPKPGQCRALADLSRCLGNVRDLDVLQVDLSRRTLPHLPTKEQKRLENVLRQIQQQRMQQFWAMEGVLVGDRYKAFKQTYRTWLKEPKYTVLADLPWETESLDLLLSLFCSLFRHPGWCFGTQVCHDQLQVLPWAEHGPALATLLQNPDRSQQLHHLRKTIKRVRYQSELFLPLYGPSLGELVQDLKRAQEILGQWQDLQVQQATIDRYLKKELETHLPNLVQLFAAHQAEIWQQWQPLQQQYLDPQYRARVRRILMQVAEPSGFGPGSH
ncbi:MAG: CHAD domain-containing protein [Prochlorothrix sp.]|nr:CHAD domain-containing protein [Prochlorothrix sp.]